jgi:hypothetical protein
MQPENLLPLESSDLPELRNTEKLKKTPGTQKLELTFHIAPRELAPQELEPAPEPPSDDPSPIEDLAETAPEPPPVSMDGEFTDSEGFGDGLFDRAEASMMQQAPVLAEQSVEPISDDILAIQQFADDNGLTIVEIDEVTGMVHLESTVAKANNAFGIELENRQDKRIEAFPQTVVQLWDTERRWPIESNETPANLGLLDGLSGLGMAMLGYSQSVRIPLCATIFPPT